jgi:lysophospholipase L1-like esterase
MASAPPPRSVLEPSQARVTLLHVRIAAATLVAGVLGGLLSLGASGSRAETTAPRSILDLGDSLSVGTGPHLRARLRGYRVARIYDTGLHAYDAAEIVARERMSLPAVLVVSAGTNDDPRIVSTFARAISGIVEAAGGQRCVVWPTIVRPPAVGATYERFNLALIRAAARHPNLVLVDWVGMVRRHPWWLSDDGVHVSVAGYRARAAAIAAAIANRC